MPFGVLNMQCVWIAALDRTKGNILNFSQITCLDKKSFIFRLDYASSICWNLGDWRQWISTKELVGFNGTESINPNWPTLTCIDLLLTIVHRCWPAADHCHWLVLKLTRMSLECVFFCWNLECVIIFLTFFSSNINWYYTLLQII